MVDLVQLINKFNMQNQNDQLAFRKAMELSKGITCEKCGGEFFQEVLILRRLSMLLTGKAKDEIQPIPVLSCTKCGHVNADFMPIFLNNQNEKPKEKPDENSDVK